jgi:predicted nucleic acid-binding protein
MKKNVYIESSVVSYLAARPSRDLVIAGHQVSTAEWWREYRDQYEVFISPLVVEEISAGDPTAAAKRLEAVNGIASLSISEEAEAIAEALLSAKAVPANSSRDALHIAISATQGIDYLLTWNFKHINNASTRILVTNVVSKFGLVCAVLCSPEELMGEDDAE